MSDKPNSDPQLSRRLADWKLDAPLPPGFRAGVWREIASREEANVSPWILLGRRFAEMFARPQFAAATAAILILLGAGSGWVRAKADGARHDESLRVRYLQSVDPYQAPRS